MEDKKIYHEDKTDCAHNEFSETKVSRHQFIKIIGAAGILVSLGGFAGIIRTPWINALTPQTNTVSPAVTKEFTAIKTPIDSQFVDFSQKIDKEFTAIKVTLSSDFTTFKEAISRDFTASKVIKGKEFVALKQAIDSDITAFKQKIDTVIINLGQNINSDVTTMKWAADEYFSAVKKKSKPAN